MIKTLAGSTKFKVIAASLALLVASSGAAFAASQGVLPVPKCPPGKTGWALSLL